MSKEVYVKNLVRKIIEFNQKVEHYKDVTALGRDEIVDRQIKKERENIIAQLDMSNIIEKVGDKKYYMHVSEIDFPLVLKDTNDNNTISIECIKGE